MPSFTRQSVREFPRFPSGQAGRPPGERHMRWQNERQSDNVEDRRGMSPRGMAVGGGLGTIIIVLLASFLTGQDPRALLQRIQAQQPAGQQQQPGAPVQESPEEKRQRELASVTLAMTEDVWTEIFARAGRSYRKPKLILFRG